MQANNQKTPRGKRKWWEDDDGSEENQHDAVLVENKKHRGAKEKDDRQKGQDSVTSTEKFLANVSDGKQKDESQESTTAAVEVAHDGSIPNTSSNRGGGAPFTTNNNTLNRQRQHVNTSPTQPSLSSSSQLAYSYPFDKGPKVRSSLSSPFMTLTEDAIKLVEMSEDMAKKTKTTTEHEAKQTAATSIVEGDHLLEKQTNHDDYDAETTSETQVKPWEKKSRRSTCAKFSLMLMGFLLLGVFGFYKTALSPPIQLLKDFFLSEQDQQRLQDEISKIPPLTLRQVLLSNSNNNSLHLAMAPAFFGFYGYFGVLDEWLEHEQQQQQHDSRKNLFASVAGASAGAMAAVIVAKGLPPQVAMKHCAHLGLKDFADFPGTLGIFRGDAFEGIMDQLLDGMLLEESKIPVAVSAFDLQTLSGVLLHQGSMARATRASATFPLLFQPVVTTKKTTTTPTDNGDGGNRTSSSTPTMTLIDGGLADMHGMAGLRHTLQQHHFHQQQKESQEHVVEDESVTVINLSIGAFFPSPPPGPEYFDDNEVLLLNKKKVDRVISIAITGLPQPGPLALEQGPLAFEAAKRAIAKAWDTPLEPVIEYNGSRLGGVGQSFGDLLKVRPHHFHLEIQAT